MTELFEKNSFTEADIHSFIKNELEESIHLDFKSSGSLGKSDEKKKELSKDISAFANSDGGFIIYGIEEKNHKANSLSFIDGNVYTKEWLEQLINTTIQRRIPDLLIFPIRFESKAEQTIYVVKIPKSHDTPHMARDKRFYKRFNFESVMMEEYEVRSLYSRTSKSKLEIDGEEILFVTQESDEYEPDLLKIQFVAPVYNNGDRPESEYKANVYFENIPNGVIISWPGRQEAYHTTRYPGSRVKISSLALPIIYPGEKIDAVKVYVSFPKTRVFEFLKILKFEIRLYYSNGEAKIEGDFHRLIDKIEEKHLLE